MNHLPQDNHLNAVWGQGARDVVAVGALGNIMRHDGKAWALVETKTTKDQ